MITLPLTKSQLDLVLALTRLRDDKTKKAVHLMLVKGLSTSEAAEKVTKQIRAEARKRLKEGLSEFDAKEEINKLSFSQQSASNARLRCERVIDLVNRLVKITPKEIIEE